MAQVTLVAANLSVPVPAGGGGGRGAPTAEGDGERGGGTRRCGRRPDGRGRGRLPAGGGSRRQAWKDREPWTLVLQPTVDVLADLGARRTNGQLLVGFAADRGERGLERAREKLANKRADLIVFNDVARDDIGFDALDNEVVLVSAEGERRIEKTSKRRIAAVVVDEVAKLAAERGGRSGR